MSPPSPPIVLREATCGDARRVWEWRRAGGLWRFFRNACDTPWPEHRAWWRRALEDQRRLMLICETGGEPIGHVRFDRIEGLDAELSSSIVLAPERRGRGLARACLSTACREVFLRHGARRVRAEIHARNTASHRLFLSCGFEPSGAIDGPFAAYALVAENLMPAPPAAG